MLHNSKSDRERHDDGKEEEEHQRRGLSNEAVEGMLVCILLACSFS